MEEAVIPGICARMLHQGDRSATADEDATVNVSEALAVAPIESVTVTLCGKVPAWEGVPERTPPVLNVKPSTPVPDHV